MAAGPHTQWFPTFPDSESHRARFFRMSAIRYQVDAEASKVQEFVTMSYNLAPSPQRQTPC